MRRKSASGFEKIGEFLLYSVLGLSLGGLAAVAVGPNRVSDKIENIVEMLSNEGSKSNKTVVNRQVDPAWQPTGKNMLDGTSLDAVVETLPKPQIEGEAVVNYDLPITWSESPNYRKGRKGTIEGIAIHSTEGSGKGSLNWLRNKKSKVSSHYLIMEDGSVYQLVKDKDTAWHVGRKGNNTYIGIEFAGYANKEGKKFTDKQYESGARLISMLLAKHKLERSAIKSHKSIAEEIGGSNHVDPGKNFDWKSLYAKMDGKKGSTITAGGKQYKIK